MDVNVHRSAFRPHLTRRSSTLVLVLPKVSRPKALIPISLGKDVFRQRSRSSRLSAKSIDPLPQGLRMLSLLIRNVMWAAWWPYSAWLLSLEKAAKRMSAEASRPPKGEETRQGQYHRRVDG